MLLQLGGRMDSVDLPIQGGESSGMTEAALCRDVSHRSPVAGTRLGGPGFEAREALSRASERLAPPGDIPK